MKYYSCSVSSICQWDLNVFQTSLNIFIKLKFNIQMETCQRYLHLLLSEIFDHLQLKQCITIWVFFSVFLIEKKIRNIHFLI